ncbi:hypothetical protein P421_03340 [Heyndrickxia coagulans P38]|jgi:hypothetical protein|nr:hypothetical protein P421_03340 [Heyndrickxia coagulans P38]
MQGMTFLKGCGGRAGRLFLCRKLEYAQSRIGRNPATLCDLSKRNVIPALEFQTTREEKNFA